jgi:hypothetical protein
LRFARCAAFRSALAARGAIRAHSCDHRLIIASGIVMAQAAGITWTAVFVTGAAVVAMLTTRLNPLWLLAAGGALGGLGLLA